MSTPIDRRTFLTALGITSAAVVVSCSSDNSSSTTTTTGAGADGDGDGDTTTTTVEVPTAGLSTDPFALGVNSGDPTASSVILWTRLVVDTTDAIPLKWEIATDKAMTELVGHGIVDAEAAWGHSVHLDAVDLEAGTEYFYRFSVDSYESPVGRACTTPAADDAVAEIRFGFASCQNYSHGYYTAHDAIAADELDAVFFLGDFIYESKGNPESFRPFDAPETVTLEQYRDRYAMYLADPSLQASRASAPWIVTWDDHEVDNNYAGMISQDGDPVADFEIRRAAAYQAFYEHQPVRLDPPEGADWPIYRTVQFGTLAEFFVLDGRQYRDDQPCGDEILTSRAACADFEQDRTMLGADQERWLADELGSADATWKVLAQQTVMSSLVLGDLILNVDQWDGYPQARERLLSSIVDQELDNVVVLTGDIHAAGAGTLHTGPEGARIPVAVEFVGTSITSNSLVDKFPGGADMLEQVEFEGIAYLNAEDKGYCRCTVTPQQWTTEFVVVDTKAESATPSVDATAVVEAGSTAVTMSPGS